MSLFHFTSSPQTVEECQCGLVHVLRNEPEPKLTVLPNPDEARIVDLTCCCCGKSTQGRQWWNRDTGYGLCSDCIDYVGVSKVKLGEEARSYGIRGLHWDLPAPASNDASAPWFDYQRQAWVDEGKYVRCAHPDSMQCSCFGRLHEGEPALPPISDS